MRANSSHHPVKQLAFGITEAFSRNGLDNLLVPLAAFATLNFLL